VPTGLRGDPTRLSQALINLLGNAVKFTESGWVQLRGELLGEYRDRLHVRFEVQDTGEGIEPEQQGRLFNAFEQADRSTTRRHGGSGLGLALTRHLVTLMGGEVGMQSSPGQGSTFWFTAWLGRAAEAGDRAAPISMQGLRALLVDDLPEALRAITEQLEQLGLQVDGVTSGEAALHKARAQIQAGRPYDVMLIDWRMAPIDGIETLQQLRGLLGDGCPPSILVTAFDDGRMWQQARSVAFDAVLIKPITHSSVHDTLVRVLRRQIGRLDALPQPDDQAEQALRRRHAGQRILLAEDNPINQEVAQELLHAAGLVVETASNGRSAVELALSRHYDLVLMDMQMPQMDGLTATRLIRERAGQGLPIVAMTANAFGEDRAACLAAGMNDHVAKPVNPDQLYAALMRWLPLHGAPATPTVTPLPAPPAPEPTAPATPLQERLAAVKGFDVEQALHNVGGQMTILVRVLGRFVQTYSAGAPALLQADDPEALAHWRSTSHTLRGACATIGATLLAEQLQAFERDVNDGNRPLPQLALHARWLQKDLIALTSALAAELQR
jgi:CheY-like chemotaxis protein/HPt (histidine-containing phosphotransfer) domain-containing protein